MASTSMIHVRVDDETKAQAHEALSAMGLSISDAVRRLLKRVATEQAFPLELKAPNAATLAAIAEARASRRRHAATFETVAGLFDELDAAAKS